ncbi:glutamate receptor ionotropic, kainate 2 [Plakobranchus ocellatus]|uniref:Glutamate receptor ionotropic, kainate 2 n=1 Tax=Plakobranchus ocellatus TaxID=259542 RepID=A0AAV4D9S5_9GAST|nr:glutamate receptor ionotropic, kainate 2 [Plakobranchus ocellatus]
MVVQKDIVHGILLAVLSFFSLISGEMKESSTEMLCIVEEVGALPHLQNCSKDFHTLAVSLLNSDMPEQVMINKKFVDTSSLFDFVNSTEVADESCFGVVIIANCPIALFLSPSRSSIFRMALSNTSVTFKLLHIEFSSPASMDPVIEHLKKMFQIILVLEPKTLDWFIDQAMVQSFMDVKHQWVVISDTTCEQALGKEALRNSNTVLFRPTHITRSSDYNTCIGKRIGEDADPDIFRAHLLSSGLRLLLQKLIADMSWSRSTGTSNDKHIFNQVQKHGFSSHEPPEQEAAITLTTIDGHVSFDRNTGLLASGGVDYCSSDSNADQGYSYMGPWTSAKNTSLLHTSLFKNVFTQFHNATLLVATLPANPFIIKTSEPGEVPSYSGFCIDLLNEMAARLNFRYSIIEPPDRSYGSRDDHNHTWNGMVGMVLRKEVSLAIGPISITSDRKSVVDFTTPYVEEGVGIITRRPGFGSKEMFRLFTPFKPSVWMCLMGAVAGAAVLLYVVNRASPYQSQGSPSSSMYRLTMFTCFWSILASSMDQGSDYHPDSHAARLVLGFWWVFIIILVSTYTANLAAVLTVTVYEKSINSLAELAEHSEIRPLIKPGTNLEMLFKTATNDVYQSIAKKLVISPKVTSNEEALVWVKTKNMAFITDRSQLEYAMLKDSETFSLADEIFNSGGLGFVVSKDAHFLDAFNLIIIKLRQSGILEGWRSRWWASDGSPCCTDSKVSDGRQLGLIYIAGPFFAFAAALCVSILLALCEWAWRTGKLQVIQTRFLRCKATKDYNL